MFNFQDPNAEADAIREEKAQYWTDKFLEAVWHADKLVADAVDALTEVEDMARTADRGGAFNPEFQTVLATVLEYATKQRNAVEMASHADDIQYELSDWDIR